MRYLVLMLMLAATVAGCARPGADAQRYSVYFQPYSAELDPQGLATVHDAAAAARASPTLPVGLAGFAAPPDPAQDIEGLSAQRAANVRQELIAEGVGADRISTVAHGTTDPNGKPNVAVRRVDISIGR